MTEEDFTHFDEKGAARQVDVTGKQATRREARAEARVRMSRETIEALRTGKLAKGDALAVARLAGIMAAKQTPLLIPLCHHVPLGQSEVEFEVSEAEPVLIVRSRVAAIHSTGVEMEALAAVSVAALAIYDMIKSRERGAVIEGVRLLSKTGGQRGDYLAPDGKDDSGNE